MIRAQRVHDLAIGFHQLVREHYKEDEPSHDKVLEVLNALANAAALVLAGIENDKAQEFFNDCLEQSIEQLIANKRKGEGRMN